VAPLTSASSPWAGSVRLDVAGDGDALVPVALAALVALEPLGIFACRRPASRRTDGFIQPGELLVLPWVIRTEPRL
jgi:hypothetical protein